MTQLQDYLARLNLKQSAFAERVGATQATVSKLATGQMRPSLELAVAIERETQGQVPAVSWVPALPPAPQPPSEDAA